MHMLSDELILAVLSNLSAANLARCGRSQCPSINSNHNLSLCCTSKAMHCFAMHDDLWRQLVLLQHQGDWDFAGTWRATYLQRQCAQQPNSTDPAAPCNCLLATRGVRVEGMYSDLLYQPFRCATAPLREEWLGEGTVPRVKGLSVEVFRQEYEVPNRPVIFTDVVRYVFIFS